jgi:DNA-binding MarR family transcriptional regulator
MLGGVTARSPRRPGFAFDESLEEALILTLFDLANHLVRRGEKLAVTAGLTTQQWLVLLQIAGDPNFPYSARASNVPVLASDIARMRGVSRATISAIVSALKDRGLIREEPDANDRRRRYLEITAAGVAALKAVEPARRAANRRLLADLDEPERKRFMRYLQSCLAILWDVHEGEQLEVRKQRATRSRG